VSVRWDVERDLLNPQFGEDIDDVLARSAFAWVVTQGFRTTEEQRALYEKYQAGGPLAAPPGRSAHNWGLAVDVAILTPGGPSWDYANDQWYWLWNTCDQHPRLHSGHHFGDDDHVQSTTWAQKRVELKQAGTW